MKSRDWQQWFAGNAAMRLVVADVSYKLDGQEKDLITKSIQDFQLGEASEGKILIQQAKEYAGRVKCPHYLETIKHLIREENMHSAYLGQFMSLQGIPRKKKTVNDSLFRFIRQLGGIELSIRVLVTAEIVALTYYKVLGSVTGSPHLNLICNRMLEDEKMHVRFQMQNIHSMNMRKFPLFSALADIFHALLMLVTLLAVWRVHGNLISKRLSFSSFFKKVWTDFTRAMDRGRIDSITTVVERRRHEPVLKAI